MLEHHHSPTNMDQVMSAMSPSTLYSDDTFQEEIGFKSRSSFKRLILLCDGTWNSAYDREGMKESTNVAKLTEAIMAEDRSCSPPIPQIVFYQTGLGTTTDFSSNLKSGIFGEGIVEKIKEAYAFLVNNWLPHDEILIFGFSRGAYTARTIGALIGQKGILEPTAMRDFYDFFNDYKSLGEADETEKKDAERRLAEYDPGRSKATRLRRIGDKTLKCIGVWDTVGALGIPGTQKMCGRKLLGFVDTKLCKKVNYAFHALAINETRRDFTPTKWKLTHPLEERQSGQVLKQVWFSGCHGDIGGGYQHHELSDITLIWMVANIVEYKLLALNLHSISSGILPPKLPWGKSKPHNPRKKGVMVFTIRKDRELPTTFNHETHEMFHPSILAQEHLSDGLKRTLSENPELIAKLTPLEDEMKHIWNYTV